MEIINKIKLDNSILKDMKEDLETKIDYAFKKAMKDGKKTKVTLKMSIEMNQNECGDYIPQIEYETGVSIKENGFKSKNTIGENYISAIDDDGNIIIEEGQQQLEIDTGENKGE